MIEYGRRTKRLPAPPRIVWADLASPKVDGVRSWLTLRTDEVVPDVVLEEAPHRLVWSSLWPARPEDRITFELAPAGGETALTFVVSAAGDPPGDAVSRHVCMRLNELLYRDLRSSYGQ